MHEIEPGKTSWYFCCTDGHHACHCGRIDEGQRLTTGQETLLVFDTEGELEAHADEHMGVPGWYAEHCAPRWAPGEQAPGNTT